MGNASTVIDRISQFKSKFSWANGKDSAFTLAQRHFFDVMISFPSSLGSSSGFQFTDTKAVYVQHFNKFITEIDLPNLTIRGSESVGVQNSGGNYKAPGNTPISPDDSVLKLSFIDTEASIFENFFFPWMLHVTSSKTHGNSNPFVRASITVWLMSSDGNSQTNEYVVEGAYPIFVDTPHLKQAADPGLPVRTVSFDFNKVTLDNTRYQGYDFLKPKYDTSTASNNNSDSKPVEQTKEQTRQEAIMEARRQYINGVRNGSPEEIAAAQEAALRANRRLPPGGQGAAL